MSDKKKYRTGFEIKLGKAEQAASRPVMNNESAIRPSHTDPMCIAILGDFSGRDNKQQYQVETIRKRRLIAVDRDNLEDVLGGFEVSLQLWLEDDAVEPIDIPIRELDDFHPDRLYQNVDIFSQLRALRKRLQNNNTFVDAAKELQAWRSEEEKPAVPDQDGSIAAPDVTPSAENLLDSLLEASRDMRSDSNASAGSSMVDSLVKQIVAPYVEPSADPRQDEMLAAVDQAIAAHMQFILHHPDFQAMEAAWLSVDFLLRRVDTGPQVKIYLMDITKHELEVDLNQDDVTTTGIYQRFGDPAPGNIPWSLLLGNYRFTDRVEEIMTLLQIGAVARKAQAPFMTAANESLLGCESFAITPDVEDWRYPLEPDVETAWSLLRHADEAEYLAMVAPGFLLRAPYGKKSKPIESFVFEEMPEVPCHSCYLWGNGAFIKAVQLAQAFLTEGWEMDPAAAPQLDRLPLHYYQADGEMVAKPCAEIQLTELGGRRMVQQGLIPLWSVKNRDSICSGDFHSLAL